MFTKPGCRRPPRACSRLVARQPQRAGLINERLKSSTALARLGEIARLAEVGARVVHNPVSNLKLKSGMAPILDLHRGRHPSRSAATTTVAPRPRTSSSRCECCACCPPSPYRAAPINAAYSLRAATSGAKAVHLDGQVGALKAGMAADLVILDLNEPAFVPLNSAVRQIVYAKPAARSRPCWWPAGRSSATEARHRGRGSARGGGRRISPGLRREAAALAEKSADLIPPLLEGNRAAWKVVTGLERYVGRKER